MMNNPLFRYPMGNVVPVPESEPLTDFFCQNKRVRIQQGAENSEFRHIISNRFFIPRFKENKRQF
jgi:hypothetical protein